MGAVLETGPRIPIHGEEMAGIGTALHAVTAEELVNPDRDDALECAAHFVAASADEGALGDCEGVETELQRAAAGEVVRLPAVRRGQRRRLAVAGQEMV